MDFTLHHRFPGTVQQFLTLWQDPRTLATLADEMPGLQSRTVLEEQDGPTHFRRTIENVADVPIPAFARDAIDPSMLRWREISELDKATHTYRFESIHGKFHRDLEQRGEVTFRQNGAVLERTIRGVLKIKVGGRILGAMGERVIYAFAKDAMKAEARIMERLLRQGR